jgi:large subunit ribosomal protein L32
VMVCPSDGGLGSKVLETWLMAVPKRKVTPSRRKRRNQFKRVPFIEEVVRCRVCGKANMPHVHCCDGLESERRPESTTGNSNEM